MSLIHSTIATVLYAQDDADDGFLPEGPRAVIVEGKPALAWVNIQTTADATAGDIHVRFWDGEHRTYAQAKRPGFLFPTDRPDTLFIGREKEVGLLHLATNTFHALAAIDDATPRTIINDGEVVPGGRAIVFGTKDVKFADTIANLYLFTLDDNRISVLADKQLCSNGKVFARDGADLCLYDIDTPTRNVVRFRLDLATRKISAQEVVLDLSNTDGFPDGMVDAGDGSVIIAFYNPQPVGEGRAIRFGLRTGAAIEEWTTPGSSRVTCPLLIENEGKIRLVLTTAIEGMPAEQRALCPNAGNLFWAETALTALPPSGMVRLM
ncbi:MAG TPA: SMP-30/gluconolactonase/LRE family protein [Gemmataceae bacterium]|jgi:sugar lactone lactonase YvrE|nr:SMP-30/gluconolactonase/LRE family protein [Gemmataceae bacterium]